jgi:hypothetical protein
MSNRKWWLLQLPLMRCPKCRTWLRFKFRGRAGLSVEKPPEDDDRLTSP